MPEAFRPHFEAVPATDHEESDAAQTHVAAETQKPKTSPAVIESSAKDREYATRYWDRIPEQKRFAYEESFQINVASADSYGNVYMFANMGSLTEKDREKMSAMRVYYQEHGYLIGKFVHDERAGTAIAPLLNVNRLKTISQKCTATYDGKYTAPLFGVNVELDEKEATEIERLVQQAQDRFTALQQVSTDTKTLQQWTEIATQVQDDLQRYRSGDARGTMASKFGTNVKELYRFVKETL